MYEGMSRYVAKVLKRATDNVTEDTDPQTLVELAETVVSLCRDKVLTEAQVEAIGGSLDIEVPEWEPETTDEGLTLQDVADGMAELSGVVSEQGEEVAGQGDAIAELSEIVSGLVPTE